MRTKTKLAMVAAAAAALFALPAPAEASSLTCEVRMITGSISPGAGFLGGEGDFTAGSNPTTLTYCSLNGGPVTESYMATRGTYVNERCGTFVRLTGEPLTGATLIDVGHDGSFEVNQLRYTLNHTAGEQGQLLVGEVNGSPEGAGTLGLDIDGRFSIVPQRGSCAEPNGVVEWGVTGELTLIW